MPSPAVTTLPRGHLLDDAATDVAWEDNRLQARLVRSMDVVATDSLATLADDAWEVAVRQARLERFASARRSFGLAGDLMAAHVHLHSGPLGAPVELVVPGSDDALHATVVEPGVRVDHWLQAFQLCLVGGRTATLDRLVEVVVPMRPTLTPHRFALADVSAQQWLALRHGESTASASGTTRDGTADALLAALDRAEALVGGVTEATTALFAEHVEVPLMRLLRQIVRREQPLEPALRALVLGHESYWTRADQVSAGCWLSLPGLAAAALARRSGLVVDVDHTYLPTSVVCPPRWVADDEAPVTAPRRRAD